MQGSVHVVDQGRRFIETATRVLEGQGLTVFTHASAQQFLDAFDPDWQSCLPSCVVCELRMDGVDGLQVADHLEAHHRCPPPIIYIGAADDVAGAVAGLKRGAVDHLEQPLCTDRLARSVDSALFQAHEMRLRSAQRAELDLRYARLTAREREVFAALMTEQTARRIAMLLGISPRTAEHHREGLMRKMEARSWQELLVMAILLDLYEPQLPARRSPPPATAEQDCGDMMPAQTAVPHTRQQAALGGDRQVSGATAL